MLCTHSSYLYYVKRNNSLRSKIYLPVSFLFKNNSLVKVILYLIIRCYKTGFFLWNADKTDINGVNKQNTHTKQTLKERQRWKRLVSMKIRDTSLFLKQPHLFCQPFQIKHISGLIVWRVILFVFIVCQFQGYRNILRLSYKSLASTLYKGTIKNVLRNADISRSFYFIKHWAPCLSLENTNLIWVIT